MFANRQDNVEAAFLGNTTRPPTRGCNRTILIIACLLMLTFVFIMLIWVATKQLRPSLNEILANRTADEEATPDLDEYCNMNLSVDKMHSDFTDAFDFLMAHHMISCRVKASLVDYLLSSLNIWQRDLCTTSQLLVKNDGEDDVMLRGDPQAFYCEMVNARLTGLMTHTLFGQKNTIRCEIVAHADGVHSDCMMFVANLRAIPTALRYNLYTPVVNNMPNVTILVGTSGIQSRKSTVIWVETIAPNDDVARKNVLQTKMLLDDAVYDP